MLLIQWTESRLLEVPDECPTDSFSTLDECPTERLEPSPDFYEPPYNPYVHLNDQRVDLIAHLWLATSIDQSG